MDRDARRLPEGTRLEADLCIIGAGPAGIALARASERFGISVLLLESGGVESEDWAQALNDGVATGPIYAGLRSTRHRQAGGSAAIWNTAVHGQPGAKYVPLDPVDFDPPTGAAVEGWPIGFKDLEPWYRAAQPLCGLGAFAYDGAAWRHPTLPPIELSGNLLANRVYQLGPARVFTHRYLAEIRAASRIDFCHHGTVCELITDQTGARVTEARVGSQSGATVFARAEVFVLAAGAIENARLLLLTGDDQTPGLGNRGGWVGRCFMEHPRDNGLHLIPASPDLYSVAGFYEAHTAQGGTVIAGRFGLTDEARRTSSLLNASVTLLPCPREPAPATRSAVRLLGRIAGRFAPRPPASEGWTRRADPGRVFDGIRLYVNLEQHPHPDNRLVLGAGRDALGVRKIELHWRWRPEEQAALERLRMVIREAFEGSGLGKVIAQTGMPPDLSAHHHAGTTRMSREARDGVVDPNARVHETENLYVVGSSVFPTVGFANPTLTILALALRLGDHLKTLRR